MEHPLFLKIFSDHITVAISVVTKSSKPGVLGVHGDTLKVGLKSPPVDGKANDELVRRIADFLNVPTCNVVLISGMTSRKKVLRILAPDPETKERLLHSLK